MGAGYSEVEKREAQRYQLEMNKAFEDDSYFNEFKRVRDFLVQELKAKKRWSHKECGALHRRLHQVYHQVHKETVLL